MYTARNKTVVVFINEIVVVIQCNVLLKVRIYSPYVFRKHYSTLSIRIHVAPGHIYVANEYPTSVKTMSIVCQKLGFPVRITSNGRQDLSILMKICKF